MSLGLWRHRWLGVLAMLCLALCSAVCRRGRELARTVSQAGARIKMSPIRPGVPRGASASTSCMRCSAWTQACGSGRGAAAPPPALSCCWRKVASTCSSAAAQAPSGPSAGTTPTPLYGVRHAVVLRAEPPLHVTGYEALALLSRQQPVVVMRGSILVQALKREVWR